MEKYYTLCVWDTDQGVWFDGFGSYRLKEVKGELELMRDDGHKAKHLRIVTSDASAGDMIAKRDALPAPKR